MYVGFPTPSNFVVNLKLLFRKMKSFENCEDIAFMETLFMVIKR